MSYNLRMTEFTLLLDGTKIYTSNGKLHRRNGPAVEYTDGVKEWWYNGKRHNLKGYAIVSNENKLTFRNGKYDPSYIKDGKKMFDINGDRFFDIIKRLYNVMNKFEHTLLILDRNNVKSYYYNGMLHREDGPAEEIDYSENWCKTWYMYGVKHREGGPAIIDNIHQCEYWYRYGMINREDGPAKTILDKYNDERMKYSWYKNGVLHREGRPAEYEKNYINNKTISKKWYKNGLLHRDGKRPAVRCIYTNAFDDRIIDLDYSAWFVNGELHREDGPAQIIDGEYFWWINDKHYSEEEYKKITQL